MRIGLILVVVLMVGCASKGPKPQGTKSAATSPSTSALKTEIVQGLSLPEIKSKKCSNVIKNLKYEDLWKTANGCAASGNWKFVEEIGNQMAIQSPEQPWGLYYLALSAEANKDFPRARWMIDQSIKKSPNEGILYYQLGRLHWLMDQKSLAIETFHKAADLNDGLCDAHNFLGSIALLEDKLTDAEKSFLKTEQLKPRNITALLGLAEVYIRKAKWSDAEKRLLLAVETNSKNMQALQELALVQEQEGKDMSAALNSYKQLKNLNQAGKLDHAPTVDFNAKIRTLQAAVDAEMKKKMLERKPSEQGPEKEKVKK